MHGNYAAVWRKGPRIRACDAACVAQEEDHLLTMSMYPR